MKDLQKDLFEQTMTVKEVAEVLNVERQTVTRVIQKLGTSLYPLVKNSQGGYLLNEKQVTAIKLNLQNNSQLTKTYLEKKLLIKQGYDLLMSEISDLEKEVETLKPKAVEYDKFMSGNNVQTMNEVAKVFGIGHKVLMKLLRDQGILMNNNTPYQKYAHYFKVIEKPIPTGENKPVTLVKPEGVDYISKKILN